MLKEPLVAIIQLHNFLYSFIYPFPLKWDESKLFVTKPTYKLIPWIISMIGQIPLILASFYNVFLSIYFPQPGRIQRVDTIFHFAVGCLTCAICIMANAPIKERSCIAGVNALNRLAANLSKGRYFKNKFECKREIIFYILYKF